MPGMPEGGRYHPDRDEVRKARMRERVIVLVLAAGALVAVLALIVVMLVSSP